MDPAARGTENGSSGLTDQYSTTPQDKEIGMRLRHRADVRTLVWALLFMPAAAAAQYAVPRLAGWLLPVSMYLAYSAGVIAHNHNHSPTFIDRRYNTLWRRGYRSFTGIRCSRGSRLTTRIITSS